MCMHAAARVYVKIFFFVFCIFLYYIFLSTFLFFFSLNVIIWMKSSIYDSIYVETGTLYRVTSGLLDPQCPLCISSS